MPVSAVAKRKLFSCPLHALQCRRLGSTCCFPASSDHTGLDEAPGLRPACPAAEWLSQWARRGHQRSPRGGVRLLEGRTPGSKSTWWGARVGQSQRVRTLSHEGSGGHIPSDRFTRRGAGPQGGAGTCKACRPVRVGATAQSHDPGMKVIFELGRPEVPWLSPQHQAWSSPTDCGAQTPEPSPGAGDRWGEHGQPMKPGDPPEGQSRKGRKGRLCIHLPI